MAQHLNALAVAAANAVWYFNYRHTLITLIDDLILKLDAIYRVSALDLNLSAIFIKTAGFLVLSASILILYFVVHYTSVPKSRQILI